MANKKTTEYSVTMRLRELVPELCVDVVSQTHLMAIRLAAAMHPAYIPVRVTDGPETWEVVGACMLCNCFILKGDRHSRHVVEEFKHVLAGDGVTVERRKVRREGVECCECRPGARLI